jgi:hypothetical protein
MPLDIDTRMVGRRLRAIMHELRIDTDDDIADRLGAGRRQFSNWKVGRGLPPVKFMYRLKYLTKDQVTLDWIYLGDAKGIPGPLAIRLEGLVAGMMPPPKQRSDRKPGRNPSASASSSSRNGRRPGRQRGRAMAVCSAAKQTPVGRVLGSVPHASSHSRRVHRLRVARGSSNAPVVACGPTRASFE